MATLNVSQLLLKESFKCTHWFFFLYLYVLLSVGVQYNNHI